MAPDWVYSSAAPVPVQLDWVRIPAGPFLMGSDLAIDPLARQEEMLQHLLELPAFQICRTPVTLAQFAAFVLTTRHLTGAEAAGWAYGWTGSFWTEIAGANWEHSRDLRSSVAAKQDRPVTCVNWHDAPRILQLGRQQASQRSRMGESSSGRGRTHLFLGELWAR
jgi:formylglycine-generating enzyme